MDTLLAGVYQQLADRLYTTAARGAKRSNRSGGDRPEVHKSPWHAYEYQTPENLNYVRAMILIFGHWWACGHKHTLCTGGGMSQFGQIINEVTREQNELRNFHLRTASPLEYCPNITNCVWPA